MEEKKEFVSFWEKASFAILVLTMVVAPIFFAPLLSFQFSKALVVSVFIVLAGVAFTIFSLKQKQILIPRSLLLYSALLVPLTFLLSSVFSNTLRSVHVSLIGYGFEVGTASFMTLMFLVLFLVVSIFKTRERVFYAFLALFASLLLVSLFQIIRLIAPGAFVFGTFLDPVSNLIGKWNDLGIFFALGSLLLLVTLESISLSKSFRNFLRVLFVLSLFFVLLVNFPTAWFVLAFVSFIFVLYLMKQSTPVEGVSRIKSFPRYALAVIVIALIAFFAVNLISTVTSKLFNISYVEVNPDWQATINISKVVLSSDPFFGIGPNKFINAWYNLKPATVNTTPFWNTDFNLGTGFVPTLMITTGFLGVLSWLAFFVFFGITAYKAFKLSVPDKFSRYLLSASLMASVFLWLISIFYIPGTIIVFLTFIFTGLFLASYYTTSAQGYKSISLSSPRWLAPFLGTIVIILLLGWGGLIFAKGVSSVYFQKGIRSFNGSGDINQGIKDVNKALKLSKNDIYYRSLAEFELYKLNGFANGTLKPETTVAEDIGTAFENAKKYAGDAVLRNEQNYYNWITLGNVYETVVPADVPQAYENALGVYKQAVNANPTNPATFLILARLEATKGNYAKAKEFIGIALTLKPNFTQAAFLLSQVEVEAGNLKNAIIAVEGAVSLEPNNATAHFQLGLLRYNDKNYRGAVEAFDKAISLVNDYANAKYFRGLSFVALGDRQKALVDFKDILVTNPDNEEIKLIISNVENRKDPFANAETPIDSKPEKREELPLKEE